MRRRRERWTELLHDAPFDERVATGLVRYLRDPTQETRSELVGGVSGLLDDLLHPGPGYASPRLFTVTRTRLEVTSPTSVRIVGYGIVDVRDIERFRLRPCMADLARPPATSTLRLAGKEDEIDEPADGLAWPSVRTDGVAWPHTFEVRLRETWKTRVLPLLAPPEGPPSPGQRVARALADYLDRPSQAAADEIAEQLHWLYFEEDGYSFGERVLTLDGPFEFTEIVVLSRTAIRLTGEAMTLDDDANTRDFRVSVELALPPATSTIQMDGDERHVATFVLPPPPD